MKEQKERLILQKKAHREFLLKKWEIYRRCEDARGTAERERKVRQRTTKFWIESVKLCQILNYSAKLFKDNRAHKEAQVFKTMNVSRVKRAVRAYLSKFGASYGERMVNRIRFRLSIKT